MQNYIINKEDGTINFFEQTFTIDDFKNRCAKLARPAQLTRDVYGITLDEAETAIRLGYATVLYYSREHAPEQFADVDADKFTVIVYCEPQSDGGLDNLQEIAVIPGDYYASTDYAVVDTLAMSADNSPELLCTLIWAKAAIRELRHLQ